MAFLCLSFVACFITWKIFFSRNTAGKYLSLDLAISLFFFTLRARQRVLITEYTVFLMRKSKRILYRLHVYNVIVHMFNLFYLFPFVSIVSVSHFYSKFVPVSFFWRQFPISYRKLVDGIFSISFFL